MAKKRWSATRLLQHTYRVFVEAETKEEAEELVSKMPDEEIEKPENWENTQLIEDIVESEDGSD